jgi:hypothetical protein
MALVFLQYALLLDAGGGLYLRETAIFLYMVLYLKRQGAKKVISSKASAAISIFAMSFLILAMARGAVSGVGVTALSWVIAIPFYLLLAFYPAHDKRAASQLVTGAVLFSATIIAIAIIRAKFPVAEDLVVFKIFGNSSAFFNEKEIFGIKFNVVYFPGTLALVPLGTIALGTKRYMSFALILIALVVAPSRFGTFSLILMSLIYLFFKISKGRKKSLVVFFMISVFIGWLTPLLISEPVRLGHVQSILDQFDENWITIFFGMGPGTLFYSDGFQHMTSDVETSHYEMVRKFGLLFYILIIIYCANAVMAGGRPIYFGLALCAHLIAFAMNPGLFSLNAALLIATLTNMNKGKGNANGHCIDNRDIQSVHR